MCGRLKWLCGNWLFNQDIGIDSSNNAGWIVEACWLFVSPDLEMILPFEHEKKIAVKHTQKRKSAVYYQQSFKINIVHTVCTAKHAPYSSNRSRQCKPHRNGQRVHACACACARARARARLNLAEARPTWSSPVLTTVSWAAVTDVKSHYPNAAISLTRSRVNEFVEMCDPFLIR